jgi:phosphoglycerol transferase MdoB-like AlkP superfamily enzyme
MEFAEMQMALIIAALAVPTALGLHVFLALLAGNRGLNARPLLATVGTTIFLCVPLLVYQYGGVMPALGLLALAALLLVALRTSIAGGSFRLPAFGRSGRRG